MPDEPPVMSTTLSRRGCIHQVLVRTIFARFSCRCYHMGRGFLTIANHERIGGKGRGPGSKNPRPGPGAWLEHGGVRTPGRAESADGAADHGGLPPPPA